MKKAAVRRTPLIQAIKSAFVNQFDFKGRSSRSEYWYFQLFGAVVSLAISIPFLICIIIFAATMTGISTSMYDDYYLSSASLIGMGSITVSMVIYMVMFLGIVSGVLLIPSVALTIRRLHDTGKSGWFYFLAFIPYAGAIVMLVFTILESDNGTNKYGDVVFYSRNNNQAVNQIVETPVINQ